MHRRPRDEGGAVMVLMAIGMVVLVLMVAIVVDLSATRSLRSQARSTADAAATAGVLDLTAASSLEACKTALAYAFANLGGVQPSTDDIGEQCSSAGMGATCTSGAARTASESIGSTQVRVTNPVPNGHPLLRATVVGGGSSQSADSSPAAVDGSDCQRVGVEITRPQSVFFGGVATSRSGDFSVHSVARLQPGLRRSNILPAMVVLEKTACKAVDAGSNGEILIKSTSTGPGVIYSDSNGSAPACSGGEGIFHAGNSAGIRAEKLSASVPGELGWFEATTGGYVSGRTTDEYGTTTPPAHYVGKLYAREARMSRKPADDAYHCNLTGTPVTPCPADPVADADLLGRRTTAPSGWQAPATCSTTGGTVTITVDTFLDCDTFVVKDNPLVVTGGATVLFRGKLKVAGGTVAVNVPSPTPPAGAAALPVRVTDTQSRLIVGSTAADAVDMNGGLLNMAQTFLYNRGGFGLQSTSSKVLWSPPSAGPTKSLLYWSESAEDFTFQGGPTFKAAGVVFHGAGSLKLSGNAEIDLTDVQMWVRKVILSGGPKVKLKPDPNNSIKVGQAGSSLIR